MPVQLMVSLVGGCSGGGSCEDYPHACGSGCTHHSLDKCDGGSGNCVNEYWGILCRCGVYYYWSKACMP